MEQAEREHPAQVLDQVVAVVLVEMEQRLGICVAAQPVAARKQRRLELGPRVDLAVVRDPHRLVLVRHRLMPRGAQVDDRESPVAERDRTVLPETGVVGSAVRDHAGLMFEQRSVGKTVAAVVEDSGDAAHGQDPRFAPAGCGAVRFADPGRMRTVPIGSPE